MLKKDAIKIFKAYIKAVGDYNPKEVNDKTVSESTMFGQQWLCYINHHGPRGALDMKILLDAEEDQLTSFDVFEPYRFNTGILEKLEETIDIVGWEVMPVTKESLLSIHFSINGLKK